MKPSQDGPTRGPIRTIRVCWEASWALHAPHASPPRTLGGYWSLLGAQYLGTSGTTVKLWKPTPGRPGSPIADLELRSGPMRQKVHHLAREGGILPAGMSTGELAVSKFCLEVQDTDSAMCATVRTSGKPKSDACGTW